MTLIETATTGKHSPETCEDGAVATHDFIAVIDGSTSKSPWQARPDMRNGRLAMLLLRDAIACAPSDADCPALCRHLTDTIAQAYQEYGISPDTVNSRPECRLTASVAVYSRKKEEVWMIGDCLCMVDGRLYENPKPAEEANAIRRAEVIHRLLAEGKETVESLRRHDKGRDAIIGAIIESCKGQNKTFSVVDGTEIAMEHVRVIPAHGAHEIVLATDGYPHLMPTLGESERELQRIIEEDPLMTGRYKATKAVMEGNLSFDDRCYVRFSP